jgi:hypothetical protein
MVALQNLYIKLDGEDTSSTYAPLNTKGKLFDYLKGDLVYHPISHYLYYAIRNNEYNLFLEIKKYIIKTSDTVYSDLGPIDPKEIIEPSKFNEVFTKNDKWENDDLFRKK